MKLDSAFWMELAAADFSDAAARTHAEAIAYLSGAARPCGETIDLSFPKRLLCTFTYGDDREAGATECVARGAWTDEGDRLRVVWHADDVLRAAQALDAKRRRDASAQAASRSRGVRLLKGQIAGGRAECAVCGKRSTLQVDHIIPRAQGGTNDPENLQVLCRKCNSSKNDRDWDTWRGHRSA